MDSVIKSLVVYFILWLVIRATGRRTLGQLTVFDFILFLIIGGAASRALMGQDYSLTHAFLVIATFVVVDVAVSIAGTGRAAPRPCSKRRADRGGRERPCLERPLAPRPHQRGGRARSGAARSRAGAYGRDQICDLRGERPHFHHSETKRRRRRGRQRPARGLAHRNHALPQPG